MPTTDLPPLVVYADTTAIGLARGLAATAATRGIRTALVHDARDEPAPGSAEAFAEIVATDDLSAEGLERIVADLERRWDVRGIATCYGGFRPEGFVLSSVATVAEARGLPCVPRLAALHATNKFLTREVLRAAGMDAGRSAVIHDEATARAAAQEVGLPAVLKPLTGIGSSLILRCDSEQDVVDRLGEGLRLLPLGHYPHLRMAPHEATDRSGQVREFDPMRSMLLEEYFDGREASVECLVVGADVVPLVVHDKVSIEESTHVVYEHVLVAPPERFSEAEVAELRDYAVAAVRALGLRDCFCHVELRYVDGAGPRLLEVNPRIGAGCVADSIETFWGVDVARLRLDLVLGEARLPERIPPVEDRHAMSFVFSPRSGVLTRLDGLDRVRWLPQVRAVRVGHAVGDVVGGDLEEVFLAGIWHRAPDTAAALATHERILELVTVEIGDPAA